MSRPSSSHGSSSALPAQTQGFPAADPARENKLPLCSAAVKYGVEMGEQLKRGQGKVGRGGRDGD